jgi:hypothetical protein
MARMQARARQFPSRGGEDRVTSDPDVVARGGETVPDRGVPSERPAPKLDPAVPGAFPLRENARPRQHDRPLSACGL